MPLGAPSGSAGPRTVARRRLPRRFYARPPGVVARDLLGRLLVRTSGRSQLVGRIVEVEAYGGSRDPASHAFRGKTRRNRSMFGPPGHAYVYFTYGMHHCLNVVTGGEGVASAVLIRALEPVRGLEGMARRRGTTVRERLACGPGCVAEALGVDRSHDGLDLTRGPLWVSSAPARRGGRRVAVGPRVGVRGGADRRWRFYLEGHPCVSVSPRTRGDGDGGPDRR